ncbi:MAG: hypothetical protein OXC95_01615 [Dehalococcoidia bacterium]|nr:hypothetical protein [Dehalococcoidia bacterium]
MNYFSDLSDFDFEQDDPLDAFGFDLEFDYMSQMEAIRGLLSRQEHVGTQTVTDIKRAEEVAKNSVGEANYYAVHRHIELIHHSIYQDAAHSMAAVGMLAPLIESIFRSTFRRIDKKLPRSYLVKNIMAVVNDKSVGMREYMPDDLDQTLDALFLYRNKMFHHGFEWRLSQREAFVCCLSNWPSEWFGESTSDDEPWMFYMSLEFISHCISTIEDVLRGLIRFKQGPGREIWKCSERDDLLPFPPPTWVP